ncbi:MAG: GNAT family N-acetyltransferase [Armatimonadetes bacterium]|nr:GNAT family N-acetyltransferase [Armatimonadota bacterium]
MKPMFETPRLVIREMSLDDLDFVAEMLADAEVMRFWPKTFSRDDSETWVLRQMDRYAEHGHGYWLVLSKASDRPVGQVGLMTPEVDGVEEPALGYIIHRPFWRNGFATEAARGTLNYAFDALRKPRVITLIRPENVPSLGVARKIGMKREGVTVHAGFEHWVFSLSREEWVAEPRLPM